jgi:hypothetical protein
MSSLFSAERDHAIASLILARAIHQASDGDLLCICSPCVRQYGVLVDGTDPILGKGEVVVVFAFQINLLMESERTETN